ncbi:MAG: hypothetical protein CM15mP49_29880 [Actinomycetota bacterium]|nr:MAG: hypothetical protein CM15mP49_29880 [Actinomycetota bacterium]
MKRDLENFGVLITGGGTGIGKACAAEMYSHGALVTICGRTEENLKQSVQEIVENHQDGGVIQYVTCDVTDEEQVLETVLAADEFGEGLDGVVANAGGGGAIVPYHMQTAEEFSRVLNLNVLGTMLCIKHAVPILRKSDKASFVGMSSIASHLTHLWFERILQRKLVLKRSFEMQLMSMGQQIYDSMRFALVLLRLRSWRAFPETVRYFPAI